MEKAKVIKIWPSTHVEVRIHVTEEMTRDFKECIKNRADKNSRCEGCSWENVCIGGIDMCDLLVNTMIKWLEGEKQ